MQDDTHWVHQTLEGDGNAFRRLVARYRRPVYAQIFVRVRNPWDAEELTNDVFFKAFRRLESLKEPSRFGSWLSQIAQHHTTDRLRQRAATHVALEGVGEKDAAVMSEWLTTPAETERQLLREEAYHQALEAMACLSERERALMEAFYVEDVSYQTLQERYHLSGSSVKKRLHKARQKVRERVEKLYGAVVTIPWSEVGRQLLKGGVEAMKLGVKAKVGIGGVAGLLALGGVLVWYASQPIVTQEEMDAAVGQQAAQGTVVKASRPAPSVSRDVPTEDKIGAQLEGTLVWLDSLAEDTTAGEQEGSVEDERSLENTKQTEVQFDGEASEKEDVSAVVTKLVEEMEVGAHEFCRLKELWDTACREEWEEASAIESRLFQQFSVVSSRIMQYLYYTHDFDSVNQGGWLDAIWGHLVRVDLYITADGQITGLINPDYLWGPNPVPPLPH